MTVILLVITVTACYLKGTVGMLHALMHLIPNSLHNHTAQHDHVHLQHDDIGEETGEEHKHLIESKEQSNLQDNDQDYADHHHNHFAAHIEDGEKRNHYSEARDTATSPKMHIHSIMDHLNLKDESNKDEQNTTDIYDWILVPLQIKKIQIFFIYVTDIRREYCPALTNPEIQLHFPPPEK